jgi:Zn-dependent protease with chaperone function
MALSATHSHVLQAQEEARSRLTTLPFAASHSDIAFAIQKESGRQTPCQENAPCQQASDPQAERFAVQVERIAKTLQVGANSLFPEQAEKKFDVFITQGDEPDSASSANGKIALNAALGKWNPYDDWLAFVIAREMGHVLARHHEENSASSIATSLIMNLLLPGSGLLKTIISAGGAKIAALSKQEVQAVEADAMAFRILQSAGYNLSDVSLALRVGPVYPSGNAWAKDFRRSSDNLALEVRHAKLVLARF